MAKITLIDVAKRTGNDATVGIVEAMSQANPFFQLAPTKSIRGNMFKYQVRSALGTAGFRAFNAGVAGTKSVIRDVIVECKPMLGISEVDKALAEASPDGVQAFRQSEDMGFISALANTFNAKAYYGSSSTTAAEIDGVGTVLSALGGTCIGAGGSTATAETSMYFWSFSDANTVQGKLPGVQVVLANGMLPSATDLSVQLTLDSGGTNKYPAYQTIFEFTPGLAIYDSRSVGRLCNIDATHLPTVALMNQVITAMFPYNVDLITCSKTVYNYVQGLKGTSAFQQTAPYESSDIFKRATTFNGIPILIDENIVATEAVVS
jgi:hypothetical protein